MTTLCSIKCSKDNLVVDFCDFSLKKRFLWWNGMTSQPFVIFSGKKVLSYCQAQSSQVWYLSKSRFQSYIPQKNVYYSIIYGKISRYVHPSFSKYGLICNFRTSEGRESFLLWPGLIKPSVMPTLKAVSKLQPPKECSLFYYIWGSQPWSVC